MRSKTLGLRAYREREREGRRWWRGRKRGSRRKNERGGEDREEQVRERRGAIGCDRARKEEREEEDEGKTKEHLHHIKRQINT